MTNRYPDQLIVDVTAAANPLPGAWILLTLGMPTKNDFNLLFGPADKHGRLVIRWPEVESQVQQTRNMFPMDYGGLASWNGTIRVVAMNQVAVARSVAALETWGTARIPGGDSGLARLLSLGEELQRRTGQELRVAASLEPADSGSVEQVKAEA